MQESILETKEIVLKFLLQEWDKKPAKSDKLSYQKTRYSNLIENIDESTFIKSIESLVEDECISTTTLGSIWKAHYVWIRLEAPAFIYFDKQKQEKKNSRKLTRREIILMIISVVLTGVVTYFVTKLTTSS